MMMTTPAQPAGFIGRAAAPPYPRKPAHSATGQWLAESLDQPEIAWEGWRKGPQTMLPAGRRFDAVRIPAELVHAAADSAIHATVAEYLTAALDGPVICDPARWYYALVPPDTTESWTCGLARCLGTGAWIGVPHTDLTKHTQLHWCVPMTQPGHLCDPSTVAALIEHGHKQLIPEPTTFRQPAR
ncbi:hypothetical protein [Streptomyces jumonjinensis]|uniref:Uncharacterized protein n=1 Tax=Streptomyces jumonjinensis TaxID=1945 RepID=A0A646KNH4_STRJU|nr:hypothetical protein [Streptomyces jumonjinensis]MQT03842.1 hypothetical protein [Streptomyces jumonjinensis]